MEKLTKKELLEQLAVIEKQELKVRNDSYFEKYGSLSFFQLIKVTTNWKAIFIIWCIFSLSSLLDIKKMYFIIIAIPALFGLAIISNVLEVKQRIKYMRKEKENDKNN